MRRIHSEKATGKRGFSRFVRPRMDSYMMACCDCGLVHEMEFYAVKITARWKDGRWKADPLPRRTYRVMFRARRAETYTRRQRRLRHPGDDSEASK